MSGHRDVDRNHFGGLKDDWMPLVCGHCTTQVNGAVVATTPTVAWVLCTKCDEGSVVSRRVQYPRPLSRTTPAGLPKDVAAAFEEARRCFSVLALHATELMCRKILMHVAVEKGDDEGKSFVEYVTFIESRGYITAPMKTWVDRIRKHGNDSTHKLQPPNEKRAEDTLVFTEQLLRLVYEMDHLSQKYPP